MGRVRDNRGLCRDSGLFLGRRKGEDVLGIRISYVKASRHAALWEMARASEWQGCVVDRAVAGHKAVR